MRFLAGKKLIWFKYFKVYCDNGGPIFRWIPKLYWCGWSKHWKAWSCRLYWLGREFNFWLGSDDFFKRK